jgi:hypothetical protein
MLVGMMVINENVIVSPYKGRVRGILLYCHFHERSDEAISLLSFVILGAGWTLPRFGGRYEPNL